MIDLHEYGDGCHPDVGFMPDGRWLLAYREGDPRQAGRVVVGLPLTLLTGIFGMNVALPRFPGGDAAQFSWLAGGSGVVIVAMLLLFRRKGWL